MKRRRERGPAPEGAEEGVPRGEGPGEATAGQAAPAAEQAAAPAAEQAGVLRDRWLRAEAELQNYRRRAAREREEARRGAEEGVMLEVVAALDDLDRARLGPLPRPGPWPGPVAGMGWERRDCGDRCPSRVGEGWDASVSPHGRARSLLLWSDVVVDVAGFVGCVVGVVRSATGTSFFTSWLPQAARKRARRMPARFIGPPPLPPRRAEPSSCICGSRWRISFRHVP